jgi:hypothetical protein
MLPEPKLNLLHIFTQHQNAYALIGAQRSGKTYQAMFIAQYWLNQNVKPLVVGYKKRSGEWSGCNQIISDNPDQITKCLQAIIKFANNRHNSQSHDLVPVPIFLDDWLWSVRHIDTAEDFFQEASTVLASANIICYFIMQSDTKDAFGGNKYGAMLKNSLTKLILEPVPDASGVIVPGQSRGFIQYPNSREKLEIDLIGVSQQDNRTNRIIELNAEGKSYREITQEVFGQHGAYYNEKVRKVLSQG